MKKNVCEKHIAVSIIIPVYNVVNYLPKCLDSILNQTLENFEVICVDDASNDGSLSVLQNYAKNDKRIQIIYNHKNMGAAVSRNIGLTYAVGDYIVFLDSDDYYDSDMLFVAYNKCVENNTDIALWEFQRYFENTERFSEILSIPLFFWKEVKNPFCIKKNFELLSILPCNPWQKMYNHEFLIKHKLKFQNLSVSDDVYFSFISLLYAKKIIYLDRCFAYHRLQRMGQISQRLGINPLCAYKALKKIKILLPDFQNDKNIKTAFESFTIHRLWNALKASDNNSLINKEYLSFLRSEGWCELGLDETNEFDLFNFTIRGKFNELKEALKADNYAPSPSLYDFDKYLTDVVFHRLKDHSYKYYLWGNEWRSKIFIKSAKNNNFSFDNIPVLWDQNLQIKKDSAIIIINSNDGVRLWRLLEKYKYMNIKIIDVDFYIHNQVDFENCIHSLTDT